MIIQLPWLSVPLFNILKYVLSSILLGTLFEQWILRFLHSVRHQHLLQGRKVPLTLVRGRLNRSGITLRAEKHVFVMIFATAVVLFAEVTLELNADAALVNKIIKVQARTVAPGKIKSGAATMDTRPQVVKNAIDFVTGVCHGINGNSSLYYPMHFVPAHLANGQRGVKIYCPLNTTGDERLSSSTKFIRVMEQEAQAAVRNSFLFGGNPSECRTHRYSYLGEEFKGGGVKCQANLRNMTSVSGFELRENSWGGTGTFQPLFQKVDNRTTWCLLVTYPNQGEYQYQSNIISCIVPYRGWNHAFAVWQSGKIYHNTSTIPAEDLENWNMDLTYIASVFDGNGIEENLKVLCLIHANIPETIQRASFMGAVAATRQGWPDYRKVVLQEFEEPVWRKVVPTIKLWVVVIFIAVGTMLAITGLYMAFKRRNSIFKDLVGEGQIARIWLDDIMREKDLEDGKVFCRKKTMLKLVKTETDTYITVDHDAID